MMDLFDFKYHPFMSSLVAFLILINTIGAIGLGIEWIGSSKETAQGEIIAMHFTHGNKVTSVGMAFTAKGAAPVIATSGHPDKWSVVVKIGDRFESIECDANNYYSYEIGDNVTINYKIGGLSGNPISIQLDQTQIK